LRKLLIRLQISLTKDQLLEIKEWILVFSIILIGAMLTMLGLFWDHSLRQLQTLTGD